MASNKNVFDVFQCSLWRPPLFGHLRTPSGFPFKISSTPSDLQIYGRFVVISPPSSSESFCPSHSCHHRDPSQPKVVSRLWIGGFVQSQPITRIDVPVEVLSITPRVTTAPPRASMSAQSSRLLIHSVSGVANQFPTKNVVISRRSLHAPVEDTARGLHVLWHHHAPCACTTCTRHSSLLLNYHVSSRETATLALALCHVLGLPTPC